MCSSRHVISSRLEAGRADLLSVAAVCRHTRQLTRLIVPCMNLRLFPHQNAAVQWMLDREKIPHRFRNPIYKELQTEDGFGLFLNSVTGEISIEMPEVDDFRGGLFCDEPGLGKTITALSLILKSKGIFPAAPPGADVCWSASPTGDKIGYYKARAGTQRMSLLKRCMAMKGRRYQLSADLRCREWCRLPILTPCLHFLCMTCVSLDRERCILPNCGKPYKMQTPKARPENPNPKWPVPQDLIELLPSYIQEDWHSEWQATSSSKVSYLIDRLKNLGQQNQVLPEKAIVFSQFLEHISAIELQLTKNGIEHAGMYSPMPAANKMKSLRKFQDDPNCVVLLMDSSSALGLDLSFVTQVFLMEPIWDRSIEEQVVSRAHRMGATRPVLVETLAMAGTIEEQMLSFLQRCSDVSRSHHDPAELHYLSRLAFVRKEVLMIQTLGRRTLQVARSCAAI